LRPIPKAIAIWKQAAQAHIALANVKAYETAAAYLRKVHCVLKKQKREPEWKTYLAELRHSHARKRRLLEILDGIEGRRIIETL